MNPKTTDKKGIMLVMEKGWQPAESSVHQDAVIAHILGSTVLGYFVEDETAHLLLDIGFIWTIYLDGQMVLLPHPVAVAELAVEEHLRSQIRDDIDQLLSSSDAATLRLLVPPVRDEIRGVEFYQLGEQRQVRILTDSGDLVIETDLEHSLIILSLNS